MKMKLCPECKAESLERCEGYSFCSECHFCPELSACGAQDIIPSWVLKHIELKPEEVRDIIEINLGMYGPGYHQVVRFKDKGSTPTETTVPVLRKIRRRRKFNRIDSLKIGIPLPSRTFQTTEAPMTA